MDATTPETRVLIVEDEPLVGMDIRETLERLGYMVTEVLSSGDLVLQSALKDSPDVILMDIHLKSFTDGIDAATRLRAIKEIPIIYMTAFTDLGMRERAERTCPAAYLIKPINEIVLQREIASAVCRAARKAG